MGNQREIRQVSPREGLGVVIPILPKHTDNVFSLLGNHERQGQFYTYLILEGTPISFPNLDGPEVVLGKALCDHLVIQSGGKMWCGYNVFVNHLRTLSKHLGDAVFLVGDEEDYIDEFRIETGILHYRRVHEGCWFSVKEFAQAHYLDELSS